MTKTPQTRAARKTTKTPLLGITEAQLAAAAPADMTQTALDYLQTIPADVLAAAARGELDLNALARTELGSRGLNWSAKWVGFDKAAHLAKCYPVRRADGTVQAVSVPE